MRILWCTHLREGNRKLDFIGSHCHNFYCFVGDKHCPKRPTVTPTVCLPVVVDLGWVSRDIIEGMIAERAYILYGERLPCGGFLCRLES